MTDPPARRGAPSSLRLLGAAIAVATAVAVLYAIGSITLAKANGLALVDVLTAPIALIVFGGPPLLAAGLAARAQTGAAMAVALAIAALLAIGLAALGAAPWHAAAWRERPGEAQGALLLGTLLGAWPLVIVGTTFWRLANRGAE